MRFAKKYLFWEEGALPLFSGREIQGAPEMSCLCGSRWIHLRQHLNYFDILWHQ